MNRCDKCKGRDPEVVIQKDLESLHLCNECFNEMNASELGVKVNKFVDAISVTDNEGINRHFELKQRVYPSGIFLEAAERIEYGYQFAVHGEHGEDPELLFQQLLNKIKYGLAQTYIKQDMDLGYKHSVMTSDKIVGRIDYSEETGDAPILVIDGKPYTWEEVGKIMISNEGFQFKIEVADMTDDLK
jgi:hypothetical protein